MLTIRNVLAAIACDYSWLIIGIWGLCTISKDVWVHGDGNAAREQPGVTISKLQYDTEHADNANETQSNPSVDLLQNTSAGVMNASASIIGPVQEPISISAHRPDADVNEHEKEE